MLALRHWVAVAFVFVLTAGLGYHLEFTLPGYVDTATVAFVEPKIEGGLFNNGQSLLVIDALTADSVMSSRGQQQVRNAGGTADYDVALVNFNDEEFPSYSRPYVTVATASDDAADAQHTFSAVMSVLQSDLATLQARQGAKPDTWIQLRMIAAPTGAFPQTGSRMRTLAGLAVLAVIAAFTVATFLERHPFRLRDLLTMRDSLDPAAGN